MAFTLLNFISLNARLKAPMQTLARVNRGICTSSLDCRHNFLDTVNCPGVDAEYKGCLNDCLKLVTYALNRGRKEKKKKKLKKKKAIHSNICILSGALF